MSNPRRIHGKRVSIVDIRVLLAYCSIALLILAVLLVWKGPRLFLKHDLGIHVQALSPEQLAEATNNLRTTLLQMLGGLVVLFGVIVTWRQLQLGRSAHLVQTFTETVGRLRSDDIGIRTGALFALGLTGQPLNRTLIVSESISSWVRNQSPPLPESDEIGLIADRLRSRAPDVQTALDILVGLSLPRNAYLRLSHSDLRRATLSDANLRGADLRNTRLDGSDLRRANLKEAHLDGASLAGADLVWADLTGAKYSNETDWKGAKIDKGSKKLPRDLDPKAEGMQEQSANEIPPGFLEPYGPNAATSGKFGGKALLRASLRTRFARFFRRPEP